MNTPIDLRTLSPTQHAALFDAARREAAVLRRQAIDDAFGALLAAPRRLAATLGGLARHRQLQPRGA